MGTSREPDTFDRSSARNAQSLNWERKVDPVLWQEIEQLSTAELHQAREKLDPKQGGNLRNTIEYMMILEELEERKARR